MVSEDTYSLNDTYIDCEGVGLALWSIAMWIRQIRSDIDTDARQFSAGLRMSGNGAHHGATAARRDLRILGADLYYMEEELRLTRRSIAAAIGESAARHEDTCGPTHGTHIDCEAVGLALWSLAMRIRKVRLDILEYRRELSPLAVDLYNMERELRLTRRKIEATLAEASARRHGRL